MLHQLFSILAYKKRKFTCKEEVLDLIYYLKPHTPPLSVPPSSPRIRSRGKDIISNGILGPVAENENIDLTCDTVGGKGYLILEGVLNLIPKYQNLISKQMRGISVPQLYN